jgi:hypothetical protein
MTWEKKTAAMSDSLSSSFFYRFVLPFDTPNPVKPQTT